MIQLLTQKGKDSATRILVSYD